MLLWCLKIEKCFKGWEWSVVKINLEFIVGGWKVKWEIKWDFDYILCCEEK